MFAVLRISLLALGLSGIFIFPAVSDTVIKDLRLGLHEKHTRLVLDLTKTAKPISFTLNNPIRFVIDIPKATFDTPQNAIRQKKGIIESLRFGLYRADMARVVLELTGPARLARQFTIPGRGSKPTRLVFDFARTSSTRFLNDLKTSKRKSQTRANTKEEPVSLRDRSKKNSRRVIVIDPGHGGVDPGAIGASGIYEKQITLGFARQLRAALEKKYGYKVILTRNRDIFIELRQRIRLARLAKADLFISIHADSIGNRKVRGSGVYTLSERSSDKETAALARRENKSDLIAGVDLVAHNDEVANILIDLTRRETMNYSAVVAEQLVSHLKAAGRTRRKTHRFAGFAVLKAPDVPSVLIEIGYLSNRSEERLLRDKKRRQPLVNAISSGVHDYFRNQKD